MSYIPPAGAIGSIEVPGADPIPLPTGRPLTLYAGVGAKLVADIERREIGVNTLVGAPPDSVSAYLHTPAVATIGRYRGTRWGAVQLVTLVEANLVTAPTATATDCHVLRVTGSDGGGVIELPLLSAYNVTGSGQVAPVVFSSHNTPYSAGNSYSVPGVTPSPRARGIAIPFRPLSDVAVLSIGYPYSDAGSTFADGYHAGWTKRVSILNADLEEIVGAETTEDVTARTLKFALPYAVRLEAGELYYLASLITDAPQGHSFGHPISVRQMASTTETGWTSTNPDTGVSERVIIMTNAAPTGTQWHSFDGNPFEPDDVTAGFLVYPDTSSPFMLATPADGSDASTSTNLWTLNGAGGGTAITGDLVVSITQRGAGPSVAGSGLNLRALIGAENL